MTKPWYKQFWPWFLIALPTTSVIASIATIVIASQDPDGLVNDDYYKQGLLINQILGKEQQAHNLGLSLVLTPQQDGLQLKLYSFQQLLPQQELMVSVSHPTRASLDQNVQVMYQEQSQSYYIPLQKNKGGWQLIIEPKQGDWRISKRIQLPITEAYTISYK